MGRCLSALALSDEAEVGYCFGGFALVPRVPRRYAERTATRAGPSTAEEECARLEGELHRRSIEDATRCWGRKGRRS